MIRDAVGRAATALSLAAVLTTAGLASCRRAPDPQTPDRLRVDPGRSDPPPSAGMLTPSEKTAVEEFLRAHPDLRPASDGDLQPSSDGDSDVLRLYGVYHPYFVRGDVNDDGVLDFVTAFVHRDAHGSTLWFSVAVFTGRGGGHGFDAGTFLERDISLSRGDLSIDRDAILITPDVSNDDEVRRYRWDPVRRSYLFVRDDEPESDSPPLSRTSV